MRKSNLSDTSVRVGFYFEQRNQSIVDSYKKITPEDEDFPAVVTVGFKRNNYKSDHSDKDESELTAPDRLAKELENILGNLPKERTKISNFSNDYEYLYSVYFSRADDLRPLANNKVLLDNELFSNSFEQEKRLLRSEDIINHAKTTLELSNLFLG